MMDATPQELPRVRARAQVLRGAPIHRFAGTGLALTE